MGKAWDSFNREIGKNTGKAVSNWVFGDAHSTPYRRVYSGGGDRPKSQRQINAEYYEAQRLQELEHQDKMQRLQQRMAQDEHKKRLVREQRLEQERIEREAKHEQEKFDATKLQEIEAKLRVVRGMTLADPANAYSRLADIVTDLDMLDWNLKCETTNKKLLVLNESLCDAYFNKYCESLRLSLSLLSNAQRDFHRTNLLFNEKRKASSKGFISSAKLITGRILNTSSDVQKVVDQLAQRIEELEVTTILSPQEKEEIIETNENLTETTTTNDKQCSFIDLNENGRIEKRLTGIWNKYGSSEIRRDALS